jgi:hypothetical protein
MNTKSEVVVHAIKESVGTFEGKAFSSCTFHCEVDLKENGAGRSLGRVTRPFKLGDAAEFDKWAHLGASLPLRAEAVFQMEAAKQDANGGGGVKLVLVSIRPLDMVKPAANAGAMGLKA